MPKHHKSIPILTCVALLAMAIGVYFQQSEKAASSLPSLNNIVILPKAKQINDVEFIDHNGDAFGKQRLLGRWSILFFGFTHCPDICPTTMQTLKRIKATLSKDKMWGNYQVIMVSVDPERDTPQQLANYVPYFDPEFIGISGRLEMTTEFARQLGILFYANKEKDDGRYDVDHSTALILLNSKAQMAGVIPAPHDADAISSDLAELAKYHFQDHTKTDNNSKHQTKPILTSTKASLADRILESDRVLQIENAWIRPAPPGTSSMAAYMEIINKGTDPINIAEVKSSLFDSVMLHQTVVDEGTASMEHLTELSIPGRSSVSLRPLSTHLMMMEPEKDLSIGSNVDVTFELSDGRIVHTYIPIREDPGSE